MSKEVKRYDATRYEALRDAAKKATPGPWRMEDDEDSAAGAMYIRQDTPDWREPIARLYGWHDQNYLEVADPTTILELLAERDALLAERDAAQKDAERFREIVAAVVREHPHRSANRGNAPGHGHSVPGVWDSDNGALAGTECAWCKTWNEAIAALQGAQP